ncbi:unnamed protein product [Effrenium voratum]|nr:unnamed protein product [Effrenium voratum]
MGIEDDDDSDSEDEEEKELVELRKFHYLPEPPRESWEDSQLHFMPRGYGHRMVTMVQTRYLLQSSILPEMRSDLEKDALSREWQDTLPVEVKPLTGRSICSFELPTAAGLLDGGVYVFQVRVGNGKSWSEWSHTSKAFLFQVPPPAPPTAASLKAQRTVNVEVISATAARVVWGDFKPAPGLAMLEYEVRATPEKGAAGSKAFPPHWVTFEHRYRGGFIEHELFNLLPFTYYSFSVQARYPKVGTRAWAGQQLSEPVILERTVAYQDPPTPLPVPGPAEDAPEMSCYAVLEFPCEEEDMQYDLEYAHVLGDELDTSELRAVNGLWRCPTDVKLLELGQPGMGGGNPQPRWRVQFPDIRNLRGDVLKLALLQRVRLRLRARITPEGSTSRWWSALSPPVSTGFASAESVGAVLMAESGRLAVEVRFQLDKRLAEAAQNAGAKELQMQRTELFQALDAAEQGRTKPGDSSGTLTWPRGFGHAFVTRYQLRTRHMVPTEVGSGEWSSWEVFPDHALPAEQPGGNPPQMKWYKSPVPLPENRDLVAGTSVASSETVQVCVRVGDGFKWSPWKAAKELQVVLDKPCPAQEEAAASWSGTVCKVSWPPAMAHAGIQEVEYQLLVVPDSAFLKPFVGAVIIAPAMEGRARKRRPTPSKTVTVKDMARAFPLKSVPKLVAGQARLRPVDREGRDDVAVEFTDLCPDLRYSFQVLARYPTVGPRTFTKVYEMNQLARMPSEAGEAAEGEAVAPPVLVQVPLEGQEKEKMQRWLQDEGRLVLLTWPGLVPEAENPRQASVMKLSDNSSASNRQYEVQAARYSPAGGDEWAPCPVVSAAFPFEGTTCVAVRSLPFAIGQFRLFDPQTMRAGPATAPIVTVYERVEPPITEMLALGRPPRTLAVRLQIPLDMPEGTGSRATSCQIRFRSMGRDEDASQWEELAAQSLHGQGDLCTPASILVREEDGLELGHVYEFQVRIGDGCRSGNWSKSSRPLRFAVSLPVPSQGGGLKVIEKGDRAEISWSPFQPDQALAAQLPGFTQLPIEYTLSVVGGTSKEPVCSLMTCETHLLVPGLRPLTAYSAMLVARWSRFGRLSEGRDQKHTLMAAFVTSGAGGTQLTAELSVRMPCEQLDGYGPAAPATARIPLEGGQPTAVTLDLDPYFVQPRMGHQSPDFVRKPSVPRRQEADSEVEDGGQKPMLPSLVPMPPPKFTTRDPMSFALLNPVVSKPTGPRPSPRRRLP